MRIPAMLPWFVPATAFLLITACSGATEEKTGAAPNRGDTTALLAELDTTSAHPDTLVSNADVGS